MRRRVSRIEPLELLHQFGRLDDQCHGEILGRMELIPVALIGKPAQSFGKIVEIVFAHG